MEDEAKDPTAAPEDPEIATLLEFEAVPRRNKRHDGWSAAHQRGFIAALATCGNIDRAAQAVDRTQSGAWTVRNSAGADGFKESWEAALSLYHRRNPRRAPPPPMARPARPVTGGRTWYNAERDGDYETWCRRQDEQRRLGAEAQAAWEERARGEAEAQAEGACNGDPERGA